MDIKSLMVGDWVSLGKKKHRCLNICGHTNDILLDNGVLTNVMNLKPIPLTPEILEKNGFMVREETDDTEYYYYDGYRINVDFYEGLPEDDIPPTILLSIDFAEKDIAMPIEYIHELQQAMRIMGCDKQIEL